MTVDSTMSYHIIHNFRYVLELLFKQSFFSHQQKFNFSPKELQKDLTA